jgi:hypothetical protein
MTRFGIAFCVIGLLLGGPRAAFAGPFEVKDTGWEGCSMLLDLARAELGEARVVPLSELDWSDLRPDDSILLLHPERALGSDKLAAFLSAGGRVAVLDDFGAGNKILERFHIERVAAPSRPLATLRHNPELAIAEPVREPIAGHGTGVHATVEDVDRLVTNHPTGLSNPKLTPVLKIRSIDGPDVVLALAGNYGDDKAGSGSERPKGKLFAMGDPSALINQMLRYPGNRAFASGLIRYLAQGSDGEPRQGRLIILTNRTSESGIFAGVGGLRSEIEGRIETAGQDLRRMLGDGFSGIVGLALAALVAFGVGVWTTTVSSRVYRRRLPSFARPVPLVAQGGTAGRIAVLSAATTPPALAVLELKSALEEGIAHDLGLKGRVATGHLLEAVRQKRALDERGVQALKEILLEMANVETLVAAGQSRRFKKADMIRLSRVVFDLLRAVRESRMERSAA